MKQLDLKSEAYRYIIQSYRQWLSVLGYNEQTVYQLPHYVQELLYYAESKGCSGLQELDARLFKTHYHRLKCRSNQRRGGGLSNNYLNKHLQALQKFCEYLRQSGRLQLPVLDIRTESDEGIVTDVLTQAEIQSLYDVTYLPYEPRRYDKGIMYHEAMQMRDRAMLTVYYGCGLRRSEGYHLDVADIHFHRSLLHVRRAKGNRERLVPVTGQGIRYLEQYLQEARPYLSSGKEAAFFVSQHGRRLSGQMLLIRLKELIRLTGDGELQRKDVHLHTLRHSIATHLLQNGMPLERIKEFLGHTSLESTQIYTHFLSLQHRGGYEQGLQQVPGVPNSEGVQYGYY